MQRRYFLLGLAGTAAATLGAGESLPGKLYAAEHLGENRSLVSLDPNTGKRTRLMQSGRQEAGPRVSPDGKTLLFACADLEADWHIRKLDLASGQETPLVESDSWPVCWVDERRFIANINFEYWLVQSDGVRVRKLAHSGGSPALGCMAPNGDFFYTIYGEPSQLAAMSLEGGVVRKLGPGSDPISSQGRILYLGKDGYLQTMVSGGRPKLVPALKGAEVAAYSPDGRYLAWLEGSKLVLATREYQILRRLSVPSLNGLCWGA